MRRVARRLVQERGVWVGEVSEGDRRAGVSGPGVEIARVSSRRRQDVRVRGVAPTHSLEAAASSSVERMASSGSVLLRDIAECWHALAAALYGSTLGGRTVFVYAIGPPERYKGQLRSGVQIKKQEARSEKLD